MTDASDTAVGVVFQQFVSSTWQPISYFSRKLTPAETRQSTFDRELLAIYLSIRHFRHFVEGREFYISTDHKPLIYSLFSNSNRYSPRQVRHLDFISEFTTDFRHVSGNNNPVADALSRIDIQAVNQLPPIIDFVAMSAAQAADPDLKKLRLSSTSSLRWEEVYIQGTNEILICDTSTGVPRPYVPKQFRYPVFEHLHSLSHPGIRATQHLLTSHYIWPSINVDVRKWTRCCLPCQRAKIHKHSFPARYICYPRCSL